MLQDIPRKEFDDSGVRHVAAAYGEHTATDRRRLARRR